MHRSSCLSRCLLPMSAFYSLLARQPVAILDGAMGTELERRGVDIKDSKLWSAKLLIQDPAVLRDIHYDYYKAGADVCTTATYQASLTGFLEEGVSPADVCGLLLKSVELCDAARDEFWTQHCQEDGAGQHGDECEVPISHEARQRPLVAYSCGSYGASLADGSEFTGSFADTMSVEQLMKYHETRLQPIKGHPAVDILAFETLPCLKEAQAVVNLLQTEGYGMPAWVSFSCKDGENTNHAESFASKCVPLLANCPGVAAIGVNCTSPKHVPQLLRAAKQALSQIDKGEGTASSSRASHPLPALLCYPNNGDEWDCEKRCWNEAPAGASGPVSYAMSAREWVDSGARLVGGCCRTTPRHIHELRRALLGGPQTV